MPRLFASGVTRGLLFLVLALPLFSGIARADDDPPDRVARLSFTSGDVSLAPAGDTAWSDATLNRPLTTGDQLLTDADGRAEMQLGGAEMRMAGDSAFNFLKLDNQATQVELSKGTLNLRVDGIDAGQSYEVDTPTVAFVVSTPGEYRIDATDDATHVSVYSGAGTVYGENNVSYALAANQTYRFGNAQLTDIVGLPLRNPDDFDQWCFSLDSALDGAGNPVASNDVAPEMVGASDLDNYGTWQTDDDYGPVWYPDDMTVGWAPYRYGQWVWISPWGWTWIDDAPWGFAPFHYGRWLYAHNAWGWVPGPSHVRPVYAPALVAFFGAGTGGPVGWCPLAPREVYVPPYRASRRYFTNVNVTNVADMNRAAVANYYDSRATSNIGYRYRNIPAAATVVPHDAFVGARPVAATRISLDAAMLSAAPLTSAQHFAPVAQSSGLQPSMRKLPPPNAVFGRPPVAHGALPPAVTRRYAGNSGGNAAAPVRPPAPRVFSDNAAPPFNGRPAPTPPTVSAPAPSPRQLPSARFAAPSQVQGGTQREPRPQVGPAPRSEAPQTPQGNSRGPARFEPPPPAVRAQPRPQPQPRVAPAPARRGADEEQPRR